MLRRRALALGLAGLQAVDVVVAKRSPAFGDAHLDHLGVPRRLRPALPVVKVAAVGALVAAADRPRLRSLTGAALVAYYSAAVAFHASSGDRVRDAVPAAALGVLAALLVWP